MTTISNNGIVTISAGDYFKTPLFINAGDEINPLRYILQENDKVYLSILEANQPFKAGIIRKIYTNSNLNPFGDVVIELNSSDTENILPGNYYYEIKLSIRKDDKDYIETIVPRRKFYIM